MPTNESPQEARLTQPDWRLNTDQARQVQEHAAQLQQALRFEATLKRITDRVRDSLDEKLILQAAVQELAVTLGAISCNAALYDSEQDSSNVRYEYTTSMTGYLRTYPRNEPLPRDLPTTPTGAVLPVLLPLFSPRPGSGCYVRLSTQE